MNQDRAKQWPQNQRRQVWLRICCKAAGGEWARPKRNIDAAGERWVAVGGCTLYMANKPDAAVAVSVEAVISNGA